MKKKKGQVTKPTAGSVSTTSAVKPAIPAVEPGRGTKEYAIQEQNGLNDNEDPNQGFSDWLTSSEGVNYMKLFVLGNSLVVFTTMAWPHLSLAFEMVVSLFYEE